MIPKNLQYYKFCAYGFLKNLRFYKPFLLLYFLEIGFSYFQIGILIAIREIFKILFEVPSGVFADKFGRKLTMVLTFSAYIISFLIFYLFQIYWIYILAMLFFGLGEAMRSGTHKSMIFRYLEARGISNKKTEYYGHTRSWSKRGSALSALFAGGMVFYSGSYRIIFLFTIIPYFIDLLLMVSYPAYLNKPDNDQEENKSLKDFFLFLKLKKARAGLLTSSLFDGFFKGLQDYLQPIVRVFALSLPILASLQDHKKIAVTIGIIYFILYLITSYATQNAHKIEKLFKNSNTGLNVTYIIGIFVVTAVGVGHYFNIEIVPIAMFLLFHILQNSRRPIAVNYVSNYIPDVSMATGLSVESQMKTIFIIIISPIMGALADKFGLALAFIFIGVIMSFGYIFAKIRGTSGQNST